MEPFFDGGLFELLLLVGFATALNYIFLKKYLLLVFSVAIVACPVALFFIARKELYYWLVSICLLNALLLVTLLWREKKNHPQQPLFNTDALKTKSADIKTKLYRFLKSLL